MPKSFLERNKELFQCFSLGRASGGRYMEGVTVFIFHPLDCLNILFSVFLLNVSSLESG